MNKKQSKSDKKLVEKITKNANIADVIFKYPEVEEIMLDYGLHCAGCFANAFDTIEAGAKIHGMDQDEIDEMVARINEVVEYQE